MSDHRRKASEYIEEQIKNAKDYYDGELEGIKSVNRALKDISIESLTKIYELEDEISEIRIILEKLY